MIKSPAQKAAGDGRFLCFAEQESMLLVKNLGNWPALDGWGRAWGQHYWEALSKMLSYVI